MTSPAAPARPGPATSTRTGVEDVSAVLRLCPATTPAELSDLLDTVLAQTRRPQRVLVLGLDGPEGDELARTASEHELVRQHRVPVVLRTPRDLAEATDALPVHPGHWLWLLPTGASAAPGTLASIATSVRRHSRVGLAGPKLVRADDQRVLMAVGHHLTAGGRSADARSPGLVDQGQLDQRQDVLGVPLAGALVRSDVLEEVGGIDPAFDEDGIDGLDLSWRAHLAGHRVLVVPEAAVAVPVDALGVVDPLRTRVRERQVALARGSIWSAPFRALGVLLSSLAAMLVLLLVKRPAEAAGEWADVRAVLAPARGLGARLRFRRARKVRPGDLRGLMAPAGTGWRDTLDTLGEALDPRARRRTPATRRTGGLETGPVADELAELGEEGARRSWFSWPLALAVLGMLGLALWRWRGLLGALAPGRAVAGSELGSVPADAGALWDAALDPWAGAGLGHASTGEPWLLPLAGWTGTLSLVSDRVDAGTALGWLLLLAPVLSVLSAYVALRRATSRRWLRAALALAWGGALPLVVGLDQGRVGPVVVHALAPLLAAGHAVAASGRGGTRRTAATFATVLGLALAARWVPLVLVVPTVAGLCLVAAGRGPARWRGLVLAVLPWALLGPWLRTVLADPVRLLGGAGATVVTNPPAASAPVPSWQTLLLAPQSVDLEPQTLLPLALGALLWLLALGALLLRGRAGARAGTLVALAVVALLASLLITRVVLGSLPADHALAGAGVSSWSGTTLSLMAAPLLLAAALLLDRAPAWSGSRAMPRAASIGAVLAGLLLALSPALVLPGGDRVALTEGRGPLPAVAAEQASGPAAQRTLVLRPDGAATDEPGAAGDAGTAGTSDDSGLSATVDLLGAEPEAHRLLRDRTADLVLQARTEPALAAAVDALTGQAPAEEAVARLTALAAGYVLVQAPEDHLLVTRLDRVPGLTRVSSPEGEVLWRLSDNQSARARVVDAQGRTVARLDATGAHGAARGDLDLPEGALLQVSEGAGWSGLAQVRVDGEPVESPTADDPAAVDERATADGLAVGVPLPAGQHTVQVGLPARDRAWRIATLALALVVAFLALPFGRSEHEHEEVRR